MFYVAWPHYAKSWGEGGRTYKKQIRNLNNYFSTCIFLLCNASCRSHVSESYTFIFITSSQLKCYQNMLTALPVSSLSIFYTRHFLMQTSELLPNGTVLHSLYIPPTALGFLLLLFLLLVNNKYFLSTFHAPGPVLGTPQRTRTLAPALLECTL